MLKAEFRRIPIFGDGNFLRKLRIENNFRVQTHGGLFGFSWSEDVRPQHTAFNKKLSW